MPGLFANWPRDFMISTGYRFHDLIVSCIFDGHLCGQSNFILYQHPEMINCYTFQLNKTPYKRAGPEAGLTMLLYIGKFSVLDLSCTSSRFILHSVLPMTHLFGFTSISVIRVFPKVDHSGNDAELY